MLEAGPWLPPDADPDGDTSLFPSRSTGDYAFPIDANRTIGVGGTSRKWNGVVTRLLPSDFRARSASGVFADWPIGYDSLARYYCEAEQAIHASGGPFERGAEPDRTCAYPVQSAAYTSPAPLFPSQSLAFFPLPFGARGGMPLRLDQEEVPRFAAAPSATFLPEHPAAALVMGGSNQLDAVEVRRSVGATRIRARHFVVAAGVIETARLLLTSRSRAFPHGIGNARIRASAS
jgi:choline dehydrogenase-like flavoprotein